MLSLLINFMLVRQTPSSLTKKRYCSSYIEGNFFIGQLGVNNALCNGVLVFFILPCCDWLFQINFAVVMGFRLFVKAINDCV